jgi:alpha-beta hydrolase superfamily lysophospholipase
MNEEKFASKDGLQIFMRSWTPETAARAVVLVVHGFKAHSGLYDWAGPQMAARGLAVYALDLRGHGLSDGERLWAEKMTDFTSDVHGMAQIARLRNPGLPVFILGHSAGGVISTQYVLEHQSELAGFICESFAHEVPAPDFVLAVLKGLSHITPHAHVLKLEDDGFSRDPKFVERMKTDPLIPKMAYPAGTVAEMVRADDRLRNGDFANITLPVFIVHGTADRVTVPHGSERFNEMGGSKDKTLKLYEDHFHDLLNDTGKEQVLADMVEWITVRIPR